MKKWLNIMTSWPVLVVQALALAGISWGIADNWISYFWIIVLFAVLLAELLNKLFSPDKATVSNNIRTMSQKQPIRFWIMIVVWLYFSVTLALHFMKRLF